MVSENGNGAGYPTDVMAAVLLDTLPTLTLPQTPSERELVDAAKAGDGEAVAALYDSYFPRVFRYILARTGRVEKSEDLAQDVLVKATIEAIGQFQWKEAPFSAWMFRIAHNEVISQRRRDSRRNEKYLSQVVSESQSGIVTVADKLEDQTYPDIDQRLDLIEACQHLTDTYREVILLRFAAGLTPAETAAAMGKGYGNIKVIQHKAIARLRELLGVKISKSKAV